jgi:ATP-dependent DNA helicase RecG
LLNGLSGFVLFGVSDQGDIIGQQITAKTLEDITQELRKIEPPAFPEIETISMGNGLSVIAIVADPIYVTVLQLKLCLERNTKVVF